MSRSISHISEFKGHEAYEVLEAEYIEEISSLAMRLRHKKTGAHLVILSNDNPYKRFDISFVTPAYSSNGLPHVLEHCVLAGSRKYPTGSYEALKQKTGSISTNAATARDHTNFYFTARNDEDFRLCRDLYLDGVFYPSVLENENIFLREGWRFDFSETEDGIEIDYNGITLNETKTSDGNYRKRVTEKICRYLMPGSVYHNRAGGKSYKIPRLSYEDLKEYHEVFYHPSNAYIYLCGDMDIEENLSFLDAEYLSRFSFREIPAIPTVPNEKELIRKRVKIHADSEESRVYVYACLFDGKVPPAQAMAFGLFKNEMENIVSHELSELGFEGDVVCSFESGCVQDRLEIHYLDDVERAGKDVLKAIRKALRKDFNADNAFRAELMAKLNRQEIRFWEAMYEKSTAGEYLFDMLEDYWFYDESMMLDVFQVSDNLQYIKNRIWGDCFNTLVTRQLPEEGREILLECIPDNKGANYFTKRMGRQLERQLAPLSQEDLRELHLKNLAYEDWAESLDEKLEEQEELELEHQPRLKEKLDARLHLSAPVYTKEILNGITFYHVPVKQSKVVWLSLNFNADEFKDHISELKLLVSFFNDRGFNDFYGLDTGEAKMLLTSRIWADVLVNRDFGDNDTETHVSVDISAVMLEENIPDVVRLMHHMMFDVYVATPFFERQLDDRIQELKSDMESDPDDFHHLIAGAEVDERMKLLDRMEGMSYLRFLLMLRENARDSLEAFYRTCYAMLNRIFNDDRLTVYCSAAERGMTLVKKALTEQPMEEVRAGMFATLNKDYKRSIKRARDFEKRREIRHWRKFVLENCRNTEIEDWYEEEEAGGNKNTAVIIPSGVNYVAYHGKLHEKFDCMSRELGAMKLVQTILEERYLRTELRERGGAYGYSALFYPSGAMTFTSYRDPNVRSTMQVIMNSADYLRGFSIGEAELEQLKLSVLESYLSDDEDNDPWGDQENVRCIEVKHMPADHERAVLEAICACTAEDIRKAADLVEEILENGQFCVFGCREDILECEELFGEIEEFDGGEAEEEEDEGDKMEIDGEDE